MLYAQYRWSFCWFWVLGNRKKTINKQKIGRISHEAADKIDTELGQMSFNNIVQSLKACEENNGSYFKAEI